MKKILVLLPAMLFAFSGCKFINEKILKKGSDTLEVYVYHLEKQLETQKQDYQASLDDIRQESQARIDSIIQYYENELSSGGGKYTTAASGTYYLIVGSFITPAYAEDYSARITGMGYQSEIVRTGRWNLVAAESHSNLRDALDGLSRVRSDITGSSWIYVDR